MASTFKRKRTRKDGSQYEVWVCEDNYEGVSKTITGRSEKEVKAKMKSWQKEMLQYGEELKKTKESFKAYALKYYRVYKKDELSHNTYRCYMLALENHILPILGNKKISDISKIDLQEFFKSKKNYSQSTLRTIRIVLNGVLNSAVEDNLIRENPLHKVSVSANKKQQKTDDKAMTYEQQSLYIKALNGERFRLVYLTLLYTGLRIGECLALKWDDYDGTYLSINKTVGLVYTYDDSGNKHLKNEVGETKTRLCRKVPLPDFLKKEFDSLPRSCDLIFHSNNGNYLTQGSLFRTQTRICKKADIPVFSLHSLRHTYATRLLELNKSPKIVQKLLGHTNIATTMNIYTHVFDEVKIDAISDLKLL